MLEEYGQRFPNTTVSIRVNPGIGAGHHSHCITGGPNSKFGIYFDQIKKALEKAKKFKLKINGIHSHIGTGIFSAEPMLEAMEMILNVRLLFYFILCWMFPVLCRILFRIIVLKCNC